MALLTHRVTVWQLQTHKMLSGIKWLNLRLSGTRIHQPALLTHKARALLHFNLYIFTLNADLVFICLRWETKWRAATSSFTPLIHNKTRVRIWCYSGIWPFFSSQLSLFSLAFTDIIHLLTIIVTDIITIYLQQWKNITAGFSRTLIINISKLMAWKSIGQ